MKIKKTGNRCPNTKKYSGFEDVLEDLDDQIGIDNNEQVKKELKGKFKGFRECHIQPA